ncbi:MAG: mechanosensitive ion channel family protein [Bdellovibrionota bacterium]
MFSVTSILGEPSQHVASSQYLAELPQGFLLPSRTASISIQLFGSFFVLFALFTVVIRYFDKVGHPALGALRAVRNILLPALLGLFLLVAHFHVPTGSDVFKIAETLVLIVAIWIAPSLLKTIFYVRSGSEQWRTRVPELFLDLLRFSLVAVGCALVIAGVWDRNLGGFFATLGVGSIVLGLALQDTLGNLMAGIALLFERPFSVGHWIAIGDVVGTVVETNWRAVHIQTRGKDLVIVPNSIMGKEKIRNFSRPSGEHGVEVEIGFSYNDPPNKVKHILRSIASTTPGIVSDDVATRTLAYGDSEIRYQVRFYIGDYERLPDIQEEYLTQVWYAVRRNGLTIPFPIRTVYKTEMPLSPREETAPEIRRLLEGVEIFSPLEEEELDDLARDAVVHEFAKGERIVTQGDSGDALYVIMNGAARVCVQGENNSEFEVARLEAGQFFGEMALLAGEARAATVIAADDIQVVVIYKNALERLLSLRPALVDAIAAVVTARQSGLRDAKEQIAHSTDEKARARAQSNELLDRMKRFLKL